MMQNSSEPDIRLHILKAAYIMFKSRNNQGIYPLAFRCELGGLIGVDDDQVLANYKLELLNGGWIKQRRAGQLVTPAKKLIKKFTGHDIEVKDIFEPEILIISNESVTEGTSEWYLELALNEGREKVRDESKK